MNRGLLMAIETLSAVDWATAFKYAAAAFTVVGMFGSAMAIGKIFSHALDGMARNPGAADKMRTYIYVGAAFAEAMGLFSLLVAFMILGAK